MADALKRYIHAHFELQQSSGRTPMLPMQGLRGLAVLLVFFVHYTSMIKPWLAASPVLGEISAGLHEVGGAGVDLFFVLSGYLIYGSLVARSQPFAAYIARRIQRIYPAFTLVFCVYAIAALGFHAGSKTPPGLLASACYLLSNFLLLPGIFPMQPMITVAWSLSYEMFFYLAIPLLVGILRMRQQSRSMRVGLIAAIYIVHLLYCILINVRTYHLDLFLVGMLLYELIKSGRLLKIPLPYALLGLAALLLGTQYIENLPWSRASRILLMSIGLFTLCASSFGISQAPFRRVFSWTPLRLLGNVSYSYYLVHGMALLPFFAAMHRYIPEAAGGSVIFVGLLAPAFALTLIPTVLLFLWVEQPWSLSTERSVPAAAAATAGTG